MEDRLQRASDLDREASVERLKKAFGEGRLDLTEFEERVAKVAESKTLGELAPLTADVPGPPAPTAMQQAALNPARALAPIMAVPPIICTFVYLLTTPGGYFWPAWVWFGCAIPVMIAFALNVAARSR